MSSSPSPSSEGSLSPALRCIEPVPEDEESDCFDDALDVTNEPLRSKEDEEIANINRGLENFSIFVDDFVTRRLQNQVNNLKEELRLTKEENKCLTIRLECLDLGMESLKSEITNSETERVRLSILEGKLIDIICSLRHLCSGGFPIESLGRLITDSLEELNSNNLSNVVNERDAIWFTNTLQRRLFVCEKSTAWQLQLSGATTCSPSTIIDEIPQLKSSIQHRNTSMPLLSPARAAVNRNLQYLLISRKSTCL